MATYSNNTTISIVGAAAATVTTSSGFSVSGGQYAIVQLSLSNLTSGNLGVVTLGGVRLTEIVNSGIGFAQFRSNGAQTGDYNSLITNVYIGPGQTLAITSPTGSPTFTVTGVVFANTP